MERKIDFWIIGASKAGSTSLNDYLTQHPHIYLPWEKDYNVLIREDMYEQREKYFRMMYKGLRHEKIVGGALAESMYFPYVAERLFALNQQMKILAILRNPIDRAYSSYWYNRRNGWELCQTFEEALKKESSRSQGTLLEQCTLTYLRHGHYYEQLRRYEKIFGFDNMYITFTDDLQGSPEKTIRNILIWLGTEPDCSMIDFSRRSNEASMPRYPWLQHILMSPDSLYRRLARKMIPLSLQKPIMRHFVFKLTEEKNLQPFRYPPMHPDTHKQLIDYYTPHNRELSKMVGRNLSHWQ